MAGGVTHYPGLASLAVTASNHGNASQLNAKRGGKLKLITCQPPTWQSQFKPPVFNKSLFFEPSIFWKAKDDIDYLRDFLIRFESIELSIKNPKRKKWVEQWVRNIIDEVLFYITNIQSLDSGWSAEWLTASEKHRVPVHRHRNWPPSADRRTDQSLSKWLLQLRLP